MLSCAGSFFRNFHGLTAREEKPNDEKAIYCLSYDDLRGRAD